MITFTNCTFINCTVIITNSTTVTIIGNYFETTDNTYPIVCTNEDTMKKKLFKPTFDSIPITFASLPKAVPVYQYYNDGSTKEEGKTPMRYNENYACATVAAPQSDTATQRDYLFERLEGAHWPKTQELRKLFNMDVDNTPKTYKELIDAVKNDKFSIDKKAEKRLELAEEDVDEYCEYRGPFFGIIWDGPKRDQDGFLKAREEAKNQQRAARDIIMTGDAAAGLKALQDFEAWLPVGKSS